MKLDKSMIPPVIYDIPSLASKSSSAVNRFGSGRRLENELERRLWDTFRLLGFAVTELGHRASGRREPDGIAGDPKRTFAIIFDGKVRPNGYSIGTDDRALREYVQNHDKRLRKKGYEEVILVVISRNFKGRNRTKAKEIVENSKKTLLVDVALVPAHLLRMIVQLKLWNPALDLDFVQRVLKKADPELRRSHVQSVYEDCCKESEMPA